MKVNIRGLKCDKEDCDYIDMTIKVDDYKDYIDCPCPKCGSSLLTQVDFDIVQKMIVLSEMFPYDPEKDLDKVSVHLNGTGDIKFEKKS